MRGYSSRSVCVCVCYHASCYIPVLYVENKVPFIGAFYYIFKIRISLKTLLELAIFADHCCLLRFLLSSQSMKETVTALFQED